MTTMPARSICLQRECLRRSASATESFCTSDTHFLITREIIHIIFADIPLDWCLTKMNLFVQYIHRVPSVCQCCRDVAFKCQTWAGWAEICLEPKAPEFPKFIFTDKVRMRVGRKYSGPCGKLFCQVFIRIISFCHTLPGGLEIRPVGECLPIQDHYMALGYLMGSQEQDGQGTNESSFPVRVRFQTDTCRGPMWKQQRETSPTNILTSYLLVFPHL